MLFPLVVYTMLSSGPVVVIVLFLITLSSPLDNSIACVIALSSLFVSVIVLFSIRVVSAFSTLINGSSMSTPFICMFVTLTSYPVINN